MKTIYKTLVLGVFLAVLAVVSPTFAQDVCADIEANQALYESIPQIIKALWKQKRKQLLKPERNILKNTEIVKRSKLKLII